MREKERRTKIDVLFFGVVFLVLDSISASAPHR